MPSVFNEQKENLADDMALLKVDEKISSRMHVEVCVKNKSLTLPSKDVMLGSLQALLGDMKSVYNNTPIDLSKLPTITDIVYILVYQASIATGQPVRILDWDNVEIYVYRINGTENPFAEQLDQGDGENNDPTVTVFNHWMLPNLEFQSLWESLVYDTDIKERLLRYMKTLLLYSDRNVDERYVCGNRLILLHGPPGTGKTTLCKALAQKLCIRMSSRYSIGQFIEVNSHSLFSKYFSESGKLVQKLFAKIHDLVADPSSLVIILIDEVESLTLARKSAFEGHEPSDAVRVVNAVLTQIDSLKKFPNVLTMTTSNMLGTIDDAFVDRADIKQFIGLPSAAAIYEMLQDSMNALVRAGIISGCGSFMDIRQLLEGAVDGEPRMQHPPSLFLYRVAKKATKLGFSGRTLRKLPVVAHAYYLEQEDRVDYEKFLWAVDRALDDQAKEHSMLTKT